MMRYVRRYFNYHSRRRAIRRWIKANGLPLVAKAMFKLNRYARVRRLDRGKIYEYKNQFIRLLYERFPHPVTEDKQTLYCYACDGTGYDWVGDQCWKCDGTGIYREYILYRFEFSIDGQRYVWHKPKRLVDWKVEIDPGQFGYREYHGGLVMGIEVIEHEEKDLLLGVMYEWLRMNGVVEIPEPWGWCPALWDCIYMDIAGWWINTWAGKWVWSLETKIKRASLRLLEILEIVEKPEEMEVPF
jgi:hypothetical protein